MRTDNWSMLAAAMGAVVASAAPATAAVTVFMDGLANPRGLSFLGDTLYVAESGSGGSTAVFTGSDMEDKFYGTTGAVSRRSLGGNQEAYLLGLPSVAGPAGVGATGPQDVGFDSTGRLHATIGLGADPNVRQTTPLQNQAVGGWMGGVVRQNADFNVVERIDLADLEALTDYDAAGRDSNPFGLGFIPGSAAFVATDAGGNTLHHVDGGTVRTLTLPGRPNPLPFGPPVYQPVPNGVTIGPDGDAYFTELTGFPFPDSAANIWRVDLDAPVLTAELVAGGFTNLIDLAFGLDGTLYALEIDSNTLRVPGEEGTLLRVNGDGTHDVILGGLASPTGLTVGPDGAWYISANGLSPTDGVVLRFIPEPGSLALLAIGSTLLLRRRT